MSAPTRRCPFKPYPCRMGRALRRWSTWMTDSPLTPAAHPGRSRGFTLCHIALLVLALPGAASAQAQGTVPATEGAPNYLSGVRSAIEARVSEHEGTVGISVFDPNTGSYFGLNEDDLFPSASLVKMGIMVDVFARAMEGTIRLDNPLIFLDGDRTSGSGIMQYMTAPKEVTVWDAILLMITMSDNTATNLLLGKLRIQPINQRMRALGLERTTIFGPVNAPPEESPMPDMAAVWGLGVTTPREMTDLLAHLYKKDAVDAAASDNMVSILKLQVFDEGIPRYLPETVEVAHKTGATDSSRNDCGIVYTGELDFIICVMTRDNEDRSFRMDNSATDLISDISLIVFDELHRQYLEGGPGGP